MIMMIELSIVLREEPMPLHSETKNESEDWAKRIKALMINRPPR